MSKTRRLLALLLALVMLLSVACGQKKPAESGGESKGENSTKTSGESKSEAGSGEVTYQKDLTIAGSNSLETMDYVTTNKHPDHEWNANFIDALLENDRLGHFKGALAEKWEHNEDYTKWTFHLRKGVKWATHDGQEYAEVKAEDFKTGLRHAAEFNSGVNWLLQDTLKGYAGYLASNKSDAEWEKVGIETPDEYTVVYNLEKSTPYFEGYATYNVLMPINRQFLESKGEGCALGKPNKDKCTFGAPQPDSILYNGGYVLSKFDQKSSIVIAKNPLYWDAENVHLETVTEIFDDGKDPYSILKGFQQGTYPQLQLRPTWDDYAKIKDQYKEYARYTDPNASTFGILFNYNRQVFENTNYATDKAKAENTKKAINNENFRKAVRAAYNMQASLEVDGPADLALSTVRNINNFPEAGMTSDGKGYFQLVTEAYNKLTGEKVNLEDGNMPFLGKEAALKYIEAAKKDGIKFPVQLDMLVIETSDRLVKKANSMKASIAENSDNQIQVELVLRSDDAVKSLTFYNEDSNAVDYDISTFSGWSPDYNDPKSFVDIFSPTTGAYMTNIGLGTMAEDKDGKQVVQNKELKEKLGFMEYEKLYREADKELKDMDKRYKLFAEADALLIQKALFIPNSQQLRGEVVSKYEPYSRPYAQAGLSGLKYKGLKLRNELVTVKEYQEIKAKWEADRKATTQKAQ